MLSDRYFASTYPTVPDDVFTLYHSEFDVSSTSNALFFSALFSIVAVVDASFLIFTASTFIYIVFLLFVSVAVSVSPFAESFEFLLFES